MKTNKKSAPQQKFIEKCFTVRQPWAYLIMAGKKNVENRGVKTNYRGRVSVHASATMDAANKAEARRRKLDPDKLPRGVLLGAVELYRCIRAGNNKWAQRGKWHWLLRKPKPLSKPRKMDG